MEDVYILAIESSCDETSAAIVKNGSEEIATVISSQIDIHKSYGGVVPEIASREHVKNITIVIEECLIKANLNKEEINAIAVTHGPGLVGSLLIGIEAAKSLALAWNKPLIPVHHISGHIYSNNLVKELSFPLLALVISGGHTQLILMKDHLKYEILGETLDDAVGEAYDKVARVLDLSYPGGPIIDKLAQQGENSYKLPIPMQDDSLNFSYSGLKSAVINLVNQEKMLGREIVKEDLAKSFQEAVVKSLANKTEMALDRYPVKRLIIAGGVAANSDIRKKMSEIAQERVLDFIAPEVKACTDNAAMIGAVAYYLYRDGQFADLSLTAKSSLPLN